MVTLPKNESRLSRLLGIELNWRVSTNVILWPAGSETQPLPRLCPSRPPPGLSLSLVPPPFPFRPILQCSTRRDRNLHTSIWIKRKNKSDKEGSADSADDNEMSKKKIKSSFYVECTQVPKQIMPCATWREWTFELTAWHPIQPANPVFYRKSSLPCMVFTDNLLTVTSLVLTANVIGCKVGSLGTQRKEKQQTTVEKFHNKMFKRELIL